MSRLCDAYKCYVEKNKQGVEILGGYIFNKTVGDCFSEKKNTVKNAMTELQNLLLTRHHGLSSSGNLQQSGQRLLRTQICKSTNKLKT